MTTITDKQLLEHAGRIQGRVMLITGRPTPSSFSPSTSDLLVVRRCVGNWESYGLAVRQVWVSATPHISIAELMLRDDSAKVVIGDIDVNSAAAVVEEIVQAGGWVSQQHEAFFYFSDGCFHS